MKINVVEIPTCMWVLDGDSFFCSHDEIEVETIVSNRMDMHGNIDEDEDDFYVCVECRKILYDRGDPAEDRAQAAAELGCE